jgi:hypothetical protein
MQEPGVQGKGERKGNVDIRLKILAPDAALHGRTSVNNHKPSYDSDKKWQCGLQHSVSK